MGENFQVYRAAVNAAKGIRHFQKAENQVDKVDVNSAVRRFDKGLNFFATALEHLEKAEDDMDASAASAITKGNDELQKCIDASGNDDMDGAAKHYDKVLDHYDDALATLDA